MASSAKPQQAWLVDGSGYIFRAYHALPPLTRADGTPVNAVLGFCNMLQKLLQETEADAIGVIFDAGRRSFRNDLYDAYKAHRPEAPPELIPQFPLIRDATRAFNLPAIEMAGYEADDLIATYALEARRRGDEVTIVSSDKDLMQLVGDGVRLFDPIKNRFIGRDEVIEKFGVPPEKLGDLLALTGDSSDNVPGVRGIGVKTAAELLARFGDLETLLARAGEIAQPKRRETILAGAEMARLSRRLVALKSDVPLAVPLADLRRRPLDAATALAFLQENQFRAAIVRLQSRLAGVAAAATQATAAPPPAAIVAARYEAITAEADLAAWIARAGRQGGVGIEIEIGAGRIESAALLGIALAVAPGEACHVPLAARGGEDLLDASAPVRIPLERALALLKPLLEDESVVKVGHNLKVAIAVLARFGIALVPIEDVMLMAYALDGTRHGHGQHLADLVPLYLGDAAGSGAAAAESAATAPAAVADMALRLRAVLRSRLIEARLLSLYETIERPLPRVVAAMELAGIRLDTAALSRLSADFAARMAALEREAHDAAGASFNVGSPKQLGEILFERLKLPGGRKAKTGAWSTGADILEELAASSGHPLPQKVLDWRQLAKLKSTYADALPAAVSPATGRVHTSFALAATSTGRLSSLEPNLQNIPIRSEEGRKIRRAFVAAPGMKLISADYSQIELRLAAEMADVAELKRVFREGGDIHAMTAAEVFGLSPVGMDPAVRRRAKAINFGIIYGISPFGLAQQLGIAQAEAKRYIELYLQRYPGISAYMERTKKLAREQGFVTTLFGRRCYVEGINDRNPARRSFMERAAINAPLQGTAADIVKRAMIRIPPALAAAGLGARMLLQVHDELLFEAPAAEAAATAALVKTVMAAAAAPALELSVPLIAEAGIGETWDEAH